MTTRRTLFIDRLTIFVVSLLLVLVGLAGIWWWSGRSGWPTTVRTTSVRDLVATGWWPWASALVGVLLVLVGLRWIAAHLTRERVSRLHLSGSEPSGRLEVAAGKVVGAAADAYADTPGVRSARGSVVRDRGQLVARIHASIEPDSDLVLLARRADEVSAQLATALQRDDLRCSVELKVATFASGLPRVS